MGPEASALGPCFINNRMKRLSIFLFLLPLVSLAQSGWVPKKGAAFVKSDMFFFQATTYYNPSGEAVETSKFSQYTFHLYGELGLGKRLALIGYLPLVRWNQFETTTAAVGQGDLKVELKYGLLTGKFPVAISIAPEFPTGRAAAFANNKSIPGDGIILPTGDGEFNVWTTLAASTSFGAGYASIYGAYNYRTTYQGLAFRDQYQIGAEIGYQPIKGLWLAAKAKIQESVGESQHPELGFVRGDATTFTGLTLSGLYQLNETWGVSAELGGSLPGLVAFRNLYVAPYYGVGVSWKLNPE